MMTTDLLQVAAIQMRATDDVAANFATAVTLVGQAAAAGARLVVLPELFVSYGDLARTAAVAQSLLGTWITELQQLAKSKNIWLVAGSIPEQVANDQRAYNCSTVISPTGEIVAAYRKIHLFDVEIAGRVASQESLHLLPGNELVVVKIDDWQVGIAICYDLRFPELFRNLATLGAELVVIPAAFTRTTGKDHWDLLVRTRALDAQAYIVAANQGGDHNGQSSSYGHSMIVEPWGKVIAQIDSEDEGIVFSSIDRKRVAEVRRQLPVLRNRRLLDASFPPLHRTNSSGNAEQM
ncbi:Nitrilase/cyanide hydratase and apolipoprotein N- acyltransferase [Pirellula staleyi DSM 6068]|uniref:Nitrilase/cyanide hydratase and apolipoprotein N-acyltransferase n=1 Tax=Pirellula staleyi (strain ATCC 27377 / DSM 6068 / ICPB 4128) TaxID=530564 RepID=D2R0U8_PIRSD|nr:carbon-nitrogen hydrolase family protein [Pirellula staleyi]ADB16696.1 Nitrilase/cyanide hydratase and apolipoprotein N- acyltransferase [Pirellula staleyi DSM 6068]